MVEPNRKKTPTPRSIHESTPNFPQSNKSLHLITNHPTRPGNINLEEFKLGNQRPAGARWNGAFTGRPYLINQLMPAIRFRYNDAPESSTSRLKNTLRMFWRMFDRCADIYPINGVEDISDIHGAIQFRDGFDRSDTQIFLALVNDTRATMGLNKIFWPVNEDKTKITEIPDRIHISRIYHYLKHQCYTAIDRIEAALNANEESTPTSQEIEYFFILFLLRSGWNKQTAMDLDIESCLLPHPTSEAHHVVRSIKSRGNTEQFAIGLEKSALSPGNIIRILAKANTHIRKKIQNNLDELANSGQTDNQQPFIRLQKAKLEFLYRSPWIFAHKDGAKMVRPNSLKTILAEINKSLAPEHKINKDISIGDFRDAYIAFSYEYSGYSWIVAKIAAGHKSLETLKHYLRKRQWKAHGEKKVLRFGNALWTLITERRIVDAAVLHAMVENDDVNKTQVDRWLAMKDRTRVGTGCKDFMNPPNHIAPNHSPGLGCRIQRCTLCPHAIVFQDSLDLLARRLAELISLKEKIPLITWLESSFADELEATEMQLERFEHLLVQEHVTKWTQKISMGEHRIVHLEGGYGDFPNS